MTPGTFFLDCTSVAHLLCSWWLLLRTFIVGFGQVFMLVLADTGNITPPAPDYYCPPLIPQLCPDIREVPAKPRVNALSDTCYFEHNFLTA